MSWITLTANDARSAMNAAELSAYQVAVIGVDQDPLADITETAVNEARGFIGDCKENQLAEGLTVPERIVHHVLAIIRFRMLTRLDLTVSDDRRTEYKDARRFLERVSECKVQIEQPVGAVDTSGASQSIELVESTTKQWTRKKQSGL